jgi:NAD(P)-dependent dehydrogenase (short-subunit alcohol dehydrogenase family)
MGYLEGKSALVTGAGRGIGRAIAMLLADEGASVVVNDLGSGLDGAGEDRFLAQQVVDEITVSGGTAIANTESVADFEAAGRMVQLAVDEFGKIDIVVNVAGILRDRMIFNMSEAEYDAVVAVHLDGTFNTVRHASALMRQQKSGRIINFSSVSAWGSPGQANYGAAKYGVLGFTAVLANSLNRYNITSNAILPYATTRMIDSTPRGQKFREEHGVLPSEAAEGTEGDPANVAPMVAYLATDAAHMVNGHFFGVRGHTISLYSHWEIAKVLRRDGGWDPSTLASVFSETMNEGLAQPEPVEVEGHDRPLRATSLMQSDPENWRSIGDGIQLWKRSAYFDAKRQGGAR